MTKDFQMKQNTSEALNGAGEGGKGPGGIVMLMLKPNMENKSATNVYMSEWDYKSRQRLKIKNVWKTFWKVFNSLWMEPTDEYSQGGLMVHFLLSFDKD